MLCRNNHAFRHIKLCPAHSPWITRGGDFTGEAVQDTTEFAAPRLVSPRKSGARIPAHSQAPGNAEKDDPKDHPPERYALTLLERRGIVGTIPAVYPHLLQQNKIEHAAATKKASSYIPVERETPALDVPHTTKRRGLSAGTEKGSHRWPYNEYIDNVHVPGMGRGPRKQSRRKPTGGANPIAKSLASIEEAEDTARHDPTRRTSSHCTKGT